MAKRIYTEIRVHHGSLSEKAKFERQLDDKVKAAGFSSRAEYIRVIALKSNILIKKEDLKMKKVKIHGYSINEGYRVFEILDRKQLESIIDELDQAEIYRRTFDKAMGYSFSGTAYTYVDARNGELVTSWQQQNNFLHPWDEFYEIVLCTVSSPIEEPYDDDLLDTSGKEYDEFHEWQNETGGDVREFFIDKYGEEKGEKEYQERIDNWIEWLATEFSKAFDIDAQLDRLYAKVAE